MKILFVDKLSLWTLPALLIHGRSVEQIWYFKEPLPTVLPWLKWMRRLKLIRAKVEPSPYSISAQFEHSRSRTIRTAADIREIRGKIKREHLKHDPLIQEMVSEWSIDRQWTYFDKVLHQELNGICQRITLVEWVIHTYLHVDPAEVGLLVKDQYWLPYLKSYARDHNVKLIGYRNAFWVMAINMLLALREILKSHTQPDTLQTKRSSSPDNTVNQVSTPACVAVGYRAGPLVFDPTMRSDFFWLTASDIPYSNLLLYTVASPSPMNAATLQHLTEEGVTLLKGGDQTFAWRSTRMMARTWHRVGYKILLNWFLCLIRGQSIAPYYVVHMLTLAKAYAYWYDFFATNNVQVDINAFYSVPESHLAVARVLALDSLGGVSATYQYTVGYNIFTLQMNVNAGEDVQFVFSRLFEHTWRSLGSATSNYVHAGYPYDSAFQYLHNHPRVTGVREQLRQHGAQFILCYFDEFGTPDEYEYLLRWVLDDPTLAIVFKPKFPDFVREQLNLIADLYQQAEQTGRCLFLSSSAMSSRVVVSSNTLPAEAALMSDVCVGMLFGTTAALEARLAGVPTVLVDMEKLYKHPFYGWGSGSVVFDSWEALRAAVEHYRSNPSAFREFGDWTPLLSFYEAFQDGQASVRIGQYIGWVYDALNQGASKQVALEISARTYTEQWGEQSVSLIP